MSKRRERYQFREYQQRQRDFDNREIDPNVLANMSNQTPEERREESVRRIQGAPHIGQEIARHLPDARDRSHLVSHRSNQGFLVTPQNQERACLPNDDQTFRTNSGSTGCGIFTRLDDRGICCVQSDLDLLSSVAAIMRGKADGVTSERIVRESYAWLEFRRPDLLPADKVVVVDTNNNGDMELLKLGCELQTSCPFTVRIHVPNENLPSSVQIDKLRGTVTFTTEVNGASLSLQSFMYGIFNPIRLGRQPLKNWRKIIIDCPVDNMMVYDVVNALDNGTRRSQQDVTEVEIKIPHNIDIHDVVNILETYPNYPNWVGDGPTRIEGGRRASVSYNMDTVFLIDERV